MMLCDPRPKDRGCNSRGLIDITSVCILAVSPVLAQALAFSVTPPESYLRVPPFDIQSWRANLAYKEILYENQVE